MGLATEQLSQQLLEYEKKVSVDATMEPLLQAQLEMAAACTSQVSDVLHICPRL